MNQSLLVCAVSFVVVLISASSVRGQRTLVVLPVHSADGGQVTSSKTVTHLLRNKLKSENKYRLIEDERTAQFDCSNLNCATKAAVTVNADYVVFGSMMSLGEKVIWDYTIADVRADSSMLTGSVSVWSVEALEGRVNEVTRSIIELKSVEAIEKSKPITYSGVPGVHVGAGLMHTLNGYKGDITGETDEQSLAFDVIVSLVYPRFSLDYWQSYRHGLLLPNVGATYYFPGSGFHPYIRASVGYNFMVPELDNDRSSNDEFENLAGLDAIVGGGFWLPLDGEKLRFMVNADYMKTWNRRDDQALVITVGAMVVFVNGI
jgi:hypothetical protein